MKVTEAQAILQTFIMDDLDTLYDKIVNTKPEGISAGMILSAMTVGVIARREGDGALEKIIEALQELVKQGEG